MVISQAKLDFETDPAQFIEEKIKAYILKNPDNCFKDIDGSPIFEEPLVGFADGDDPLFQEYKSIIGDFHLNPREVLGKYLREQLNVEPPQFDGISVICWILPAAKGVRLSNGRMTDGPSRLWNNMRWLGQSLNDKSAQYLVSLLVEMGYQAVAPDKTEFFKVRTLPNGRTSNWSHRHAAYAAGLGTFSLSDGLITPRGIAMRCNSVVTNLKLPATARKYASHVANCPFLVDGSCGVCIERCPAGAITAQGHDKNKCRENIRVTQQPWLEKPGYMGEYAGCGLCQSKVPCEAGIPKIKTRH